MIKRNDILNENYEVKNYYRMIKWVEMMRQREKERDKRENSRRRKWIVIK